MSSDLKLKEGLAAVIGGTVGDVDTLVEASKIAAAKYVPILRDAQQRIEVLEAEVAALKLRVLAEIDEQSRIAFHRNEVEARAERLEAEVAALRVTQERQNSDTMLLRQCYVTLAFAFSRLHESARSRDGELCLDFQRVRALIEKRFREIGIKL